jgi:hypothetical protein
MSPSGPGVAVGFSLGTLRQPPQAGSGAPSNVLLAEDGTTPLLAEDGATYLTQES